jgi:hypothetical protein
MLPTSAFGKRQEIIDKESNTSKGEGSLHQVLELSKLVLGIIS